jgi:NTP pyrophosphatase (non-canonical NTP hydrolase)
VPRLIAGVCGTEKLAQIVIHLAGEALEMAQTMEDGRGNDQHALRENFGQLTFLLFRGTSPRNRV